MQKIAGNYASENHGGPTRGIARFTKYQTPIMATSCVAPMASCLRLPIRLKGRRPKQ